VEPRSARARNSDNDGLESGGPKPAFLILALFDSRDLILLDPALAIRFLWRTLNLSGPEQS
jgi:hypothetical protein